MNTRFLSLALAVLGMFFTAIGGFLDMSDRDDDKNDKNRLCISKQHFWNDGLFLILLAIFILLYNKEE